MIKGAFVILAMLASGLCAAAPGTISRTTELKKEPATDAPTVAQLAEGAKLDTLEAKPGWIRVKVEGGGEGWVRQLNVRYAAAPGAAAKPGDAGVGQLLNVARTGSSGTQVTTGVRGLDAEDLANARPNPAELEKMRGYATGKDAAAGFAAQGPLQAQRIEYPKVGP